MKNASSKYFVMFIIALALLAGASFYSFVLKRAPQIPPQEEETASAPEAQAEETQAAGETAAAAEAESTVIDLPGAGILGVAKKEEDMFDKMEEGDKRRKYRPITLESSKVSVVKEDFGTADVIVVPTQVIPAEQGAPEEDSARTMLTAPVGYRIITTQADFDKFKKSSYGIYPKVDFSKKSFLILESKNNLPDNIFEIKEVRSEGGKNIVDFGVNILGLKERTAGHTFAIIDKGIKTVELKQVM